MLDEGRLQTVEKVVVTVSSLSSTTTFVDFIMQVDVFFQITSGIVFCGTVFVFLIDSFLYFFETPIIRLDRPVHFGPFVSPKFCNFNRGFCYRKYTQRLYSWKRVFGAVFRSSVISVFGFIYTQQQESSYCHFVELYFYKGMLVAVFCCCWH